MYNKFIKSLSLSRVAAFILLIQAYLMTSPRSIYAQQPPRIDGLVVVFMNIMNLVFPIAALVAMFMIVVGGYLWMVAGGDAQKLQKAQGTITWAVLGLIFLAIFRFFILGFYEFLTT